MGRRRTNLAWLIAVIAGIFMVVPTLASAQEQGSTEAEPTLTDEVTADEPTTTEDPATETPPADPPAEEPVVPAEPTEPAPVEEPTEPADSAGFDGSADTSKAPEPEASSEPASAPAPAEAAAPETEPAEVAAVEAEATDSPGNSGGGSDATAGRAVARGGGDIEANVKSSESKPGCLARGGVDANEIHNTFPTDGSCVISLFENGAGLSTDPNNPTALPTLNGPNGPVALEAWITDGNTVHVTLVSGGPVGLSLYVKGGTPHNICTDNSVANGETVDCSTAVNPNNGNLFGFSHLDVCVRPPTTTENPPPIVVDTPPEEQVTPPEEEDVLTEEEREQREQELQEQLEELEELAELQAPPVPTAVTPAPEEALPFTGLDTGWLVLLSVALLGSGVLLRRKVS
jgi:hypothetical protein